MSALFEPITLRSLTLANRVWMAPMCQYSAATEGQDRCAAPTGTSRTTRRGPPAARA